MNPIEIISITVTVTASILLITVPAFKIYKIKSFSDIRNLNQFQKVNLTLTFSGGFLIFLKFITFWITQNRFLETILIAGTSCFILFSIYLTSDVLAQKYINYKNKKQKK